MPEFYSPLENITTTQGRDVQFTCVVNHLGEYRVSTFRYLLQTFEIHVLIFEFQTVPKSACKPFKKERDEEKVCHGGTLIIRQGKAESCNKYFSIYITI